MKRKSWIAAIFAIGLAAGALPAQSVKAQTAAPAKGFIYVNAEGQSFVTVRSLEGFANAHAALAGDGSEVRIVRDEDTLAVTINSKTASLNGEPEALKAAPFKQGGSALVPLSALGSAFGWTLSRDTDAGAGRLLAPGGEQLRLPIAPGQPPADLKPVVQQTKRFKVGGKTHSAQVVTVALLHPGVRLDTVLAGDRIGKVEELASMAKRAKAAVAINGTFFDAYTDGDFKTPYGYIAGGGVLKKNSSGDKRATFVYDRNLLSDIIPGLSFMDRFKAGSVDGALQAGPRLVTDGKISLNVLGEGFRDPKILTNGGARSALGITRDHRLILLTTGGATIPQLAEIMKQAGAWQAMNLDGGASSGLWVGGKYLTAPGRKLSNALVVRVG